MTWFLLTASDIFLPTKKIKIVKLDQFETFAAKIKVDVLLVPGNYLQILILMDYCCNTYPNDILVEEN